MNCSSSRSSFVCIVLAGIACRRVATQCMADPGPRFSTAKGEVTTKLGMEDLTPLFLRQGTEN
ncbi:hypothetical protein, partial [Burkholderia territorii]|uniref:hypothetical protein n=1 Tax=Burkholderia territorii TaxID=1503055 RepID=UPI001BA66FB5